MSEVEQDRIDQRIFVLGVPRTGTTLVQSLLSSHSAVMSFTEGHFFSRHFFPLPGSRAVLTRDPRPRVKEFLAENGRFEDPSLDRLDERIGRTPRFLLPLETRLVAGELILMLDGLALERQRSTWIEKTPQNLHYIRFLESCVERLDDGSRTDFVHVVRRGLPTVASLFEISKNWERGYGLRRCVRRWNRDMQRSLARASSARDHFIFYEELTSDPGPAIRRLLDSLGLDWEPEILDRYSRTAESLVTAEESWKNNVERSIEPRTSSVDSLTERQRLQVTRLVRDELYDRLRSSTRRDGR